tara:strand:- start:57 stop:551 length:495 start_codon:yes stop_codon:yes gene_type:complete
MDSLLQYDLVDKILSGFSNVVPQQIVIENSQGWVSNVWETITYENNEDKPSRVDFETKLQELVDSQPKIRSKIHEILKIRNTLLSASDWTQLGDVFINAEMHSKWKKYRKMLRELPESGIDYDSDGNPLEVRWPINPDNMIEGGPDVYIRKRDFTPSRPGSIFM